MGWTSRPTDRPRGLCTRSTSRLLRLYCATPLNHSQYGRGYSAIDSALYTVSAQLIPHAAVSNDAAAIDAWLLLNKLDEPSESRVRCYG